MPTILPGFQDTVHDAQQSFRQILAALARPGQVQKIGTEVPAPPGLMCATAAAALTLLDLEITVWLQPGFDHGVPQWLVFHTGCRMIDLPAQADFAMVGDASRCPELAAFHQGQDEHPEASTTVLVQVPALTGGEVVQLQGPGIDGKVTVAPQVAAEFWHQWRQNTRRYPLGVDVLLLSGPNLLGLPRTARID